MGMWTNRISVFIQKDIRELSLSTMWRHNEEIRLLARKGALTRAQFFWLPDLGLQLPELWEMEVPQSMAFVMEARAA